MPARLESVIITGTECMLDEKNWWSAAYRGRDKVRGVLVRGLLNS